MRSLVVVCAFGVAVKHGSIPCSATSDSSLCCSGSLPAKPTSVTRAPSWARFMAALAAPPGRSSRRVARTTGTGASGEMRSTSPQTYWSSITSPTTSTGTPCHPASISSRTSREIIEHSGAFELVFRRHGDVDPLAQHVAEQGVHLLHARGVRGRHVKAEVGQLRHSPVAAAAHGYRAGVQLMRTSQRRTNVGTAARGGNSHHNIARLTQRVDLPFEDVFKAKIVGDGGEHRRIGGERERWQGRART